MKMKMNKNLKIQQKNKKKKYFIMNKLKINKMKI